MDMKRLVGAALVVLIGGASLCGSLAHAEEAAKKKDTIFIGRLRMRPSVVQDAEQDPKLKTDLARARDTIESQMPVYLGRTGMFDLVERERLGELVEEEKLNYFQDGTIGMLKKTGAAYAFYPEIDTFVFGEDRSGMTIDGVGRRNDIRLKMLIRATVRVVEVATSKMLPDLVSVQWPKRGEPDYGVIDGENVDFAVARQQMLVDMSEQVARIAVIQSVGCVRPAKVLIINEADGRQAMVNRGDTSDFKKGAAVKFYATQTIQDPDTGENLTNEVYAGKGVVDRAEVRKCFVKILEESKDVPVAAGSVAKLDDVPVQTPTPSQGTPVPPTPPAQRTPESLPNASEWVGILANPDKVRFTMDKLKKNISVVKVAPKLLPTGFLKISTELAANEETTVTGTYKWFDADGAPVAPGDGRPKTVFLRGGKVPAPVDGTAPDTRVRSFELVIEPQGK